MSDTAVYLTDIGMLRCKFAMKLFFEAKEMFYAGENYSSSSLFYPLRITINSIYTMAQN